MNIWASEMYMSGASKAVNCEIKAFYISRSLAIRCLTMTLSDRLSGKVKLDAKMWPATALNTEEEQSLVHLIYDQT